MIKRVTLLVIGLLFFANYAYAQQSSPEKKPENKKVKGESYIEFQFIHEQMLIEQQILVANCLGIEIDNYFAKNHGGVSGYTVSYKKVMNYSSESGHFFGGKAFREFKVSKIGLKVAAGFEWGYPSGNYDKTNFSYDDNGGVDSYKHIFEKRNSEIPFLKPDHDGTWHPLVDFSVVKRGKVGIVEAGVRAYVMSFGIDGYHFNGGDYVSVTSNRVIVVPSVFVSFGLKM